MVDTVQWLRPASTSIAASGPPLNATCIVLMPAIKPNRAPLKWPALPVAPEPKMSLPGCVLASAMKSLTVLTFNVGVTTSTLVLMPICPIPMKSFSAL